MHPPTFRPAELTAEQYYRAPFAAVLRASDLTAFTLLSAEGMDGSGDEQDLAGIPEAGSDDDDDESEGEVAEEVAEESADDAADEEDACGEGAEGAVGPEELVGAEPADGSGGSDGAEVRYLETLGRLSGQAAPIGNLARCACCRRLLFSLPFPCSRAPSLSLSLSHTHTHTLFMPFQLSFILRLCRSGAPRATKKEQRWEAASSHASTSWSFLKGSEGTEVIPHARTELASSPFVRSCLVCLSFLPPLLTSFFCSLSTRVPPPIIF